MFGHIVVYFPGLEKEEEPSESIVTVVLLIFLPSEGTVLLAISSSALISPDYE